MAANLKCRVCNVILTDTNWYPSNKTRRIYLCIDCTINKSREYKLNNIDKVKKYYENNREVINKKARDRYSKQDKKQLATKARTYRQRNKDYFREYDKRRRVKRKEYDRKFKLRISVGGGKKKLITCIKRPHTLCCEICNKEYNKTAYHHWDDCNPNNGMWVCRNCHITIERIEKIPNIKEIYLSLKQKIEGELHE